MIVSIHQPCLLYYIGFWNKIWLSDIHIIYDDVLASKYDHTNRFKVKSPQQNAHHITLPVEKKNRVVVNQMKLRYFDKWDQRKKWDWRKKIKKTIKPWYKQSPYFNDVYPIIKDALQERFSKVVHFNLFLFHRVIEYLDLKKIFYYSSEIGYNHLKGSERLACLTEMVNGSTYLSGDGGRKYTIKTDFDKLGIRLAYQKFNHPKYNQLYGDFIEYLSILDLLFNEGSKSSLEIIKSAGVIVNE